MSSKKEESLERFTIAGLPLIISIIKRLNLKSILSKYIPLYGNEKIPVVDALILLICNITIGRQPLYKLKQWVQSIDPKCFELHRKDFQVFNDDRFGRALDKLYLTDRASLMTEIVIKMIKEVKLDLSRFHNDSTTIKAYGKIPGETRTGLKLAHGNSKEHRPDLKQLVFNLTISSDGAVPVHYKTYSGNRTDDTTHIETWNIIRKIAGRNDFIYVADCKVCTSKQLSYIVGKGGRVVTIIPNTWKETKIFKEELRSKKKKKICIWCKKIPMLMSLIVKNEYFSLFCGDYKTKKAGYRIYWFHSSEKRNRDRQNREQRLQKAEKELLNLIPKINKRKLKNKKEIETQVEKILKENNVKNFYEITIYEKKRKYRKQIKRGRPGINTKYKVHVKSIYSLLYERDEKSLKREKNVDGIFPLLTTDHTLLAKEVLQYYKYQPRLEKRFTQFRSVHAGAPLLFKKIERVESIMFSFFLSLMIQAIIEREVRLKMKIHKIKSLLIYPEFRNAYSPTTSKILDNFDAISIYRVKLEGNIIKEFRDSLTTTQKKILNLLNIKQNDYWGKSKIN